MRDRSVLQSGAQEALAPGPEPRRHTVFVGGFPCQDLSIAGKQAGLDGERSGLHRDYLEVIEACRPDWIVTENVAHKWRKWVPELRRRLARIGYSSLPLRVRASDLGAPHERARIYLVAHANGEILRKLSGWWLREGRQMADEFAFDGAPEPMADSDREPERQPQSEGLPEPREDARPSARRRSERDREVSGPGWWTVEPNVGRVADGVPNGVDSLTAIGNAVVPQIPEIIARGIKECMR